MRFYLIFSFLGFKVADKRKIIFFKGTEDFRFLNFLGFDREV